MDYKMFSAFWGVFLMGMSLLLLWYYIRYYSLQLLKFIFFILGKDKNYTWVHLILFLIPTALLTFVLILLFGPHMDDSTLYTYIAAIPLILAIIYLIKSYKSGESKQDDNFNKTKLESNINFKLVSRPVKSESNNEIPKEVKDTKTDDAEFCKHCGKPIPTSSVYCKYCGTKLK